MPDHKRPLLLATAAWTNLLGLTHAYQAAVMRGDVEEANAIRAQAHDMLDSNLDLNGEAAQAVRALAEGDHG